MSDWISFSERPREEQYAMLRRLALDTRNYSYLADPPDHFPCRQCGHLFPGSERRRQLIMQFVDMCPDCARKGGEAEA